MPAPAEAVAVLVVGAGPAGCAASIRLASAGLSVAQLSRPRAGAAVAVESLAPAAMPVLRQLGVADAFAADGHRACRVSASAWGRAVPAQRDSIGDPQGPAWHIDRPRFERRLVVRAAEAGARQVQGRGHWTLRRDDDRAWLLQVPADGVELRARWLVDASGTSSCIARRVGAQRSAADRQVALVATLVGEARDEPHTLVEAVASGWWYSGPTPGAGLACFFFTDPDLARRPQARTRARWQALLSHAPLTRERIERGGCTLASTPRWVEAAASRLDRFAGPGWLAAGDAAFRCDPVAGHGLSFALASGRDAAEALLAHEAGDTGAPQRYAEAMGRAQAHCAARAAAAHGLEQRWPSAPYWARRQGAPACR